MPPCRAPASSPLQPPTRKACLSVRSLFVAFRANNPIQITRV
ncbi:Protein of unknown function [Micromonospora lupini str. Lupac 08]|uniref:Uncharacterized protein n=1 Tax=Micromonospora lupini str. Lupac 08 TaxID=1150864 RepID=I0KX40_9ACTN|nr:Protein of unknown function [Micromonospora lupini str. Lupac 08]